MQDISKKIKSNNCNLSKKYNLPEMSDDDVKMYFWCYNRIIERYKEIISDILDKFSKPITFPLGLEPFEQYFTGYKFNFIDFDNSLPSMPNCDGMLEFSGNDDGVVNIFYNTNCNTKRQRFTKVHELLHFCQLLDMDISDLFDFLLIKADIPVETVLKLLERTTDKATAIYLMPDKYFINKCYKTRNVYELSDYFQVSVQSVIYRLKECKQFI